MAISRTDVAGIGGLLMLIGAIVGTWRGWLPGRFGEYASTTVKPLQYWGTLAGYYLLALAFLCYFLFHGGTL